MRSCCVFFTYFLPFPVCAEVRARERPAARGGWGEADGRGRAAGRGVDAEGARVGGQARGAAKGGAGLQDEDLLRHGQPPALPGGLALLCSPALVAWFRSYLKKIIFFIFIKRPVD